MAYLEPIGTPIKDFVLGGSRILTAEYVPGIVVLLLVVVLVLTIYRLGAETVKFCRVAKAARLKIRSNDDTGLSRSDIEDLNGHFLKWARTGNREQKRFGVAWGEFEETLVPWQTAGGTEHIGNAVRPSVFFNLFDMGVSMTRWRAWPAVFVTVGLLLTFLGLIAALQQTDKILSGGEAQEALGTLLTVASAKFIMSLTGLACSIVFGFVLRYCIVMREEALHEVCAEIESCLNFVSQERLAAEQLVSLRDQSEQTRTLITKKVSELNEPLRDAISEGIATAMGPVVQQIGTVGSDGVGAMVNDLSARFTEDVAGALGSVSDRLSNAGSTLEALAGKMDQSSSQMGGAMESAISRLATSVDEMRENAGAAAQQTSAKLTESAEAMFAGMRDSLDGIKANTENNSMVLDRAAASMSEAAASFRSELNAAAKESREAATQEMNQASAEAASQVGAAGLAVAASMGTSIAAVTQQAEALGEKVSNDLFGPLNNMRDSLTQAADRAAKGAADMARFSEGAERGATSVRTAAGLMGETAEAMANASTPIRDTAERFEKAARETAVAANAGAETMKTGAQSLVQSAQTALEAGREALRGEQAAIEANLTAIETALEKFDSVASRFDDIDDKLGKAFAVYRQEIESALGDISAQSTAVNQEYTKALDTLRTVVDKAESYQPEQNRR